ncbi:MAG: acyltransferase family protein [Anaerolineales bacterium]|nr:acyltransferase family protein [Anaerolineales bacterium]
MSEENTPVGAFVESEDNEELRQLLLEELERLIERLQQMMPGYTPLPFSPQRLLRLIEENLGKFSAHTGLSILGSLRSSIREDLFDIDTWKGAWYVIHYSLEHQADFLKRRFTGEYETDEWGLDTEFLQAVEPFFNFLYKTYWRVETSGMEKVPEEGAALLVCNHSGQLPWDGAMLGAAIYNEHPNQRVVRSLYADWFPTLPFVSAFLTRLGQIMATEENGVRLLEQEHLVSVFPEGYKGVGKLFRERYRLARFGRNGFVRMALKTGAPMIPVAIVGAEETYISLAKSPTIARLIGFPYFPITLTWPWLGPLGLVPLPTKWYIDIGEPIPMDGYAPEAADNLVLVSQLTDQVRNIVQEMILERLANRRSVFFG